MAGLAKSVGTWVLGEGGCQRRSGVRVKGEMVSVVDGVGFTRRVGVGTVLRDGSPGVCREGGGGMSSKGGVWCGVLVGVRGLSEFRVLGVMAGGLSGKVVVSVLRAVLAGHRARFDSARRGNG